MNKIIISVKSELVALYGGRPNGGKNLILETFSKEMIY